MESLTLDIMYQSSLPSYTGDLMIVNIGYITNIAITISQSNICHSRIYISTNVSSLNIHIAQQSKTNPGLPLEYYKICRFMSNSNRIWRLSLENTNI